MEMLQSAAAGMSWIFKKMQMSISWSKATREQPSKKKRFKQRMYENQ